MASLPKDPEAEHPAARALCSRCRERPGVVQARINLLCAACYAKYLGSKVNKAVSGFKVKGKEPARRFLLALSFGHSSLALLDILVAHQRSSLEKVGRYGFTFDVLFVEDSSVFGGGGGGSGSDEDVAEPTERLWQLAEHYRPADHPMIRSFAWKSTQVCFDSSDAFERRDLQDSLQRLKVEDGRDAPSDSPSTEGSAYRDYIASLRSLSAQVDANSVMTRRFIIAHAKEQGCEGILWGDSTTRLAERTLAEAAKGRGFSMPWQTGDGPTPYGVNFVFPFREVLRKEVVAYVDNVSPQLARMVRHSKPIGSAQVSSKDATIDALMMEYFASVEQNFPSIVTNVVRTSSKLDAAQMRSEVECALCGLPIPQDQQGLSNWAGNTDKRHGLSDTVLCYGCARTTEGRKT